MADHKLDPRLRAASRKGRKGGKPEPVFIEVASAAAAHWLKAQRWVKQLVQVVDGYYTAIVPADRLDALAARKGVIEVEGVKALRPHLDRSVPRIHGREPAAPHGEVPDGRSVVIGIVDYGLDFTQKDFQNPADGSVTDAHNPRGITRLAYLWDQELKPRKNERAPRAYGYGVEYSSRDIDRALRARRPARIRHDPLGARDLGGHGTHVAGIAAGNGGSTDGKYRKAGKYRGVAPAATLVFVSLSRGAMVRQVEAQGGTLANSINLAHAIAYCFAKADELGMPCVVNLSLGANGGGHDGDTVLEWIIDALLRKRGRAVVIAAGNEDNAELPIHATGTLKQGSRAALEWMVGAKGKNDPSPNEMELWYPRGNAVKASLVAPDGEQSKPVAPGESHEHAFAKGETAIVDSDAKTPWTGAARIHIELRGAKRKGIRFGAWRVKLEALRAPRSGVRYDAWIERTLPAGGPVQGNSHFARYDARTTINLTTPGTSRRAITVASCSNDGSPVRISAFSSRGPTRDARRKPELTAPGDPVTSTNARGRPVRKALSGTSMAAPHVTGVAARMLGRNARLSAESIREILVKSAAPPPGGAKWHPKWGYGTVNAARAVALVPHRMRSSGSGRMSSST